MYKTAAMAIAWVKSAWPYFGIEKNMTCRLCHTAGEESDVRVGEVCACQVPALYSGDSWGVEDGGKVDQ